jgi:hypothetical protein
MVHRPDILGPAGIVGLVLLLWGFVCLRRKSAGFSLAEMKTGTQQQRSWLRQTRRGLMWAMLIETVLCSVAVGSVEYLHRLDLIWPALGIAVSLHFLPLGRLFRVRRYYFTGIAGTACVPGGNGRVRRPGERAVRRRRHVPQHVGHGSVATGDVGTDCGARD